MYFLEVIANIIEQTLVILRFISRMLRGKSLSSSLRVIATEDVNMHSIIVRSEMCVTYTSSK